MGVTKYDLPSFELASALSFSQPQVDLFQSALSHRESRLADEAELSAAL
jgi:hypothetical protein